MKLRLNVATTPQENHRPFVAGVALAGGAALIALLLLSHEALATWRSNTEVRSQTAQLEREIQTEQAQQQDLRTYFQRKDVEQIRNRADFLNSLISERSFPWTRIFMDLENTLPPGVRVVSIAPKLVNGRADVEMVVGANSEDSKLRFLKALENAKNFSDVTVDDERTTEQANGGDRITVRLNFWYATET